MCIWTDLAANVVVVYSLHTIGSTGKAAMLLKQSYIGIDTSPEYIEISKARIIDAISSIDTEPSKHKEASKHKDIDTQFLFDNI